MHTSSLRAPLALLGGLLLGLSGPVPATEQTPVPIKGPAVSESGAGNTSVMRSAVRISPTEGSADAEGEDGAAPSAVQASSEAEHPSAPRLVCFQRGQVVVDEDLMGWSVSGSAMALTGVGPHGRQVFLVMAGESLCVARTERKGARK